MLAVTPYPTDEFSVQILYDVARRLAEDEYIWYQGKKTIRIRGIEPRATANWTEVLERR